MLRKGIGKPLPTGRQAKGFPKRNEVPSSNSEAPAPATNKKTLHLEGFFIIFKINF
jgi:hypothetical protein